MHPFPDLEDGTLPSTLAFVKRQNAATKQALCDAQFEQDCATIQAVLEDDRKLIVPHRAGEWLYNFHRSKQNPRGVWRRIPHETTPLPQADWEIVFDLDAFCAATGGDWVWGGVVFAPFNPNMAMLRLSEGGSDRNRYIEYDVARKAVVDGGFDLAPARAHVCWVDPDTILLSTSAGEGDATNSGWQRSVRRVSRGDDPLTSPILFRVKLNDVAVTADIYTINHSSPLIIYYANHEILDTSIYLQFGSEKPRRLNTPRQASVDCNETHFAIFTRADGAQPAGSLLLGALSNPEDPEPIFKAGKRVVLNRFFLLRDWLVWTVLDNLCPRLFILRLGDSTDHVTEISLPATANVLTLTTVHANWRTEDAVLWVLAEGILQAPVLYRLDLTAKGYQAKLDLTARAPAHFNTQDMTVQRYEATSEDGTKVPYHIAIPKDEKKMTGSQPVLLWGYGGFEIPVLPGYRPVTGKCWLERGGAYVVAHIRGGGEFGHAWHQAAKQKNRHKAYEDFAAIARDLVQRGVTHADRIACHGGSNGGLLTGVMLTRYADLFGAIWSAVPVLDMLRFHKFPAGVAWIDEYGDPEQADDRDYLLSYSPIHNVKPFSEQPYPPVFFDSVRNDDRVDPSHARRMAAVMREKGHTPLFHEAETGGHGGSSATPTEARRLAMGFAFLRKTLKLGRWSR